jgi:hypothetical protein
VVGDFLNCLFLQRQHQHHRIDLTSSMSGLYDDDFRAKCTWELCGLAGAFFGYRPSRAANLAFTVLFGISLVVFLAQGFFVGKRWLGFTIAMVSGCALEVIGYIGRVMAYNDLWSNVSKQSPP